MKKSLEEEFLARIPEKLRLLAANCPAPVYVVGGSVRDFLAGKSKARPDWDLSSPAEEEVFLAAAEKAGLEARAVYRNTGTVKLKDGEAEYEFTRFRSDRYVRGLHAPAEVFFTQDIGEDARRRDFCANAVYFDVKGAAFLDPLGGMEDIKKRLLRTVAPAEKVFGEDGLRLMRLARFAAQTGFSPDADCLEGAKKNCALIRDIVPERVFAELSAILAADGEGAYRGLCLLRDTGVLAHILPELAAGDGMPQRSDFHAHDVLEHSFRCVRYAPPSVRLAALLHDVGKPYCFLRDGNFHSHPEEGARIAGEILARLKAPKKLAERTGELVLLHMRDFNLRMRPAKVRREILRHAPLLDDLLALKQADFSACKDDLSPAPCVVKWKTILEEMRAEHVPLSLKELAVNGNDLLACGVPPEKTGGMLNELLLYCVEDGARNTRAALLKHVGRVHAAKEGPHGSD